MQAKRPCFLTLFLLMTLLPAHAQTFQVLHTFAGAPKDGEGPFGGLIRDSAGNLYGTTVEGGTARCGDYGGCGTAFILNKAGKEVGQFSFDGSNGFDPMAGLLRDSDGNLFGTTTYGGDIACFELGCGTVFKISKNGKETVLHKFTGAPDGWFPEALLVEDSAGNLYGTTLNGGTGDNGGAVFKVDNLGNESLLYSFCSKANCADGNTPYPGVVRDLSNNLYGVTGSGGAYDSGVVYEVDANGNETVLYSFTGDSDGGFPDSVLLLDENGNLYGTTQFGGNYSSCEVQGGCGVVFELSPPQAGGDWIYSLLYTFCSQANCVDGAHPVAEPLIKDGTGNLYGTTELGGAYRNCNGFACGVVFKLDPTGKETVLHSFTGGSGGSSPWSGVTLDDAGNLYGTATAGGDTTCFPPSGCGVAFEITP